MADGEIRFTFSGVETKPQASRAAVPASRGDERTSPLLDPIKIERHFSLSATTRASGAAAALAAPADQILALEMDDGFVFYTSAGALRDDLARLDSSAVAADGSVRLDALRARGEATRGLSDWLLRGLSVIGIDRDAIFDKAVDEARAWLGDRAADWLEKGASWAATKVLTKVIEEHAGIAFGLCAWDGTDALGAPLDLAAESCDEPLLVFVHGAASSTRGSFGKLSDAGGVEEWEALRRRFGQRVFAFEHRTFSESPIDNAVELVAALPRGARLHLVTHSRGGQVGDLLCLGDLSDDLIRNFRRRESYLQNPPPCEGGGRGEVPDRDDADEHDRKRLHELQVLLREKRLSVERYVRVACPARGTLLASAHLDAFLSTLLHLVGLIPQLQAPAYAMVKRIVLQIVKNRTDPRLVPGIESMLPDSPLTALLGRAAPQEGLAMAIVAGDIEGGPLLKRIGTFLTDHLFFAAGDNDLVVDTESMYGGVAPADARFLFDRGGDVSHFRYFANDRTRRAVESWLTEPEPAKIRDFSPLIPPAPTPTPRAARAARGPKPLVLVVPDVFGSCLRVVGGDPVWFEFSDVARGGLANLEKVDGEVVADRLLAGCYADLCEFLRTTHEVRPVPYDWRLPWAKTATVLAEEVERALDEQDLAVRVLCHGAGGLILRGMIAKHRRVWDALVARDGSRCLMLGTPNRGTHSAVQALLGASPMVRALATLDPEHSMQWLLDRLARFPGVLQLLPRPDSHGGVEGERDYFGAGTWRALAAANRDKWFGNRLAGVPNDAALAAARAGWDGLSEDLPNVDRIAYLAGCGRFTPCGVETGQGDRGLQFLHTSNGDGSVTHASGVLDCLRRANRVWFVDADHGGLAGDDGVFPVINDLLVEGVATSRAEQNPSTLRGGGGILRSEVGPVLFPSEDELERQLVGGRRTRRRRGAASYSLRVSVRAMDLRHARDPVLVGHYEGDPIAGAEAQIDRHLVQQGLTLRKHIGLYAGPLGTATVVLLKASEPQAEFRQRGAVVVGLGEYGELTSKSLTEAVRVGVLRYLLQIVDQLGGVIKDDGEVREVGLAALLLGFNSTTNIAVEDSVRSVVRGVLEANRRFRDGMHCQVRVARLEFVELYLDAAISATYAVRRVAQRLRAEAERLGARIEGVSRLSTGASARPRLEVLQGGGYWPRLIVTKGGDEEADGREGGDVRKIRYVLLSQRARAEATEVQSQPGLVEHLIDSSVRDPSYKADVAHSLFELLVANDLKETLRRTASLVLVVDGYTANLPWEMLVADEEPLVKNTAIVRQLKSADYRRKVRSTLDRTAFVLGNPVTLGSAPPPAGALPGEKAGFANLPNAEVEAENVSALLEAHDYDVELVPASALGADVINKLLRRSYRVVHISAHGVYRWGKGADLRSGVVLSDGLLITAAEIGQMELVPDLVFLNCCFSGKTDEMPATPHNKLAYSVARELIEIGVRAVVVSGWAVDDAAARYFAECFYEALLTNALPFGDAVRRARLRCLEHASYGAYNTWGAFQAYGDPGFLIDPTNRTQGDGDGWDPVAVDEVVASVDVLRHEAAWARAQTADGADESWKGRVDKELQAIPADWAALPGVAQAVGRLCADGKDLAAARCKYVEAIARDDGDAVVAVRSIEQLANVEARLGHENDDEALVRSAIDRLLSLGRAAGGMPLVDSAVSSGTIVNRERCALLGSAYKRLALVLREWSVDGDPLQPRGVREALLQSAVWYRRGEGVAGQADYSPYNVLNRLALQFVLGENAPNDAALALSCGDLARERYKTSLQYWDLLMYGDAAFTARLIDGTLTNGATAENAAAEIVDCYRGLRDQLPENPRQLDSVIEQIRALARLLSRRRDAGDLVERLETIADRIGADAGGRRRAARNGNRGADPAKASGEADASESPPKRERNAKSGAPKKKVGKKKARKRK